MITALDTNVLLDVLIPNEIYLERSEQAIRAAARAGSTVICDIVYSELCFQFDSQSACDSFLDQNEIGVDCLTRSAHFLASRIWGAYRQQGGKRTRILPDFLVAAHAQVQADCLVTRDRGFYSDLFPFFRVVDPTHSDPQPLKARVA